MNTPGQSVSVYESLKKKIEEGQLSPGENLREMELSGLYNVSRNTIKKALLMLERDTLVVIEQNKGAKVRSYSLEEVLDFLEIRSVLEGFITRLSCLSISDSQLDKLKDILIVMKELKEKNELISYSQNNQKFHEIIYDSCPNKTAMNLLVNLKRQMKKYNTKTILIPGRSGQSFVEHQAIFEALKNGNSDEAEKLMVKHILNVREVFSKNYQLLL